MFAGLKNKIKEETGSDVSKLPPVLTTTATLNKGHHSRNGSSSSISNISLDGSRDENASSPTFQKKEFKNAQQKDVKQLEKREEEWRRRLEKREEEWRKILQKKEAEWQKTLNDKTAEWQKTIDLLKTEKTVLEEEKLDIVQQKLNLQEALRAAEEYKKKIEQYREDVDQLEGLQTQELAKVKHLLLVKEQEVTDKVNNLKEAFSQIEELKSEVNRLRRYEEEFTDLQDEMETLRHSFARDRSHLSTELARSDEEVRHLKERITVLEQRASTTNQENNVDDRVRSLMSERLLLERRLEEAHLHLSDIKTSWSEKISSLETQVGRLGRQAAEEGAERRRVEGDRSALLERVKALEVLVEKGRSTVREKEEEAAKFKKEKDELASELATLRREHEREVEELHQQIETLLKDKSQLEEAASKVERLESDNSELRTSLDSKKTLILRLEEESKQFQLEAESEKMTASQLKSESDLLQLKLESETAKATRFESESRRLQSELEIEKSGHAAALEHLRCERAEKEDALVRNAELNQQAELVRRESRESEQEITDLRQQLEKSEKELLHLRSRVSELEVIEHDKTATFKVEQELRASIQNLEDQLTERNKNIRVLQQRLGDMKKTLQKELKQSTDTTCNSTSQMEPDGPRLAGSPPHPVIKEEDDVVLTYLKHVLMKFLTSREYEAKHLTRAVATLLRFSAEEEKLLKETLEWKMSWFGTRPSLGVGQTSKTIPHS